LSQFKITYNRHRNRYSYRSQDFPESYELWQTSLESACDPDWSEKIAPQRINLKKWILYAAVLYYMVRRRRNNVSEFERFKRNEQRAMQNEEAKEV
jgi:hypothetical protein